MGDDWTLLRAEPAGSPRTRAELAAREVARSLRDDGYTVGTASGSDGSWAMLSLSHYGATRGQVAFDERGALDDSRTNLASMERRRVRTVLWCAREQINALPTQG